MIKKLFICDTCGKEVAQVNYPDGWFLAGFSIKQPGQTELSWKSTNDFCSKECKDKFLCRTET